MKKTAPLVFCLILLLTGCESLLYYSQAAVGQFSILRASESIEVLIEDPATSTDLKQRLELVRELTAFAARELQLPVDGQYSHYVDLERNYVVWNVFAAPELSLTPKTWCYPIAGCTAYRGYFKEQSADNYAAGLASENYDIYVGGVAAYSTLGWLNDPVLNTFIYREEAQLADLLFHELAHKQLYVPGDTLFNESFATAVASEGVRRWMAERDTSARYGTYQASRARQGDFLKLLGHYRALLQGVYLANDSDEEKRLRKRALIAQLREDFGALQHEWGDSQAYSAWMAAPINNAKLNSVALYFDGVPAFEALLVAEDFELPRFYERARQLGEMDIVARHQLLESPGGAAPPSEK
jgi:predicted aminopeptidase